MVECGTGKADRRVGLSEGQGKNVTSPPKAGECCPAATGR